METLRQERQTQQNLTIARSPGSSSYKEVRQHIAGWDGDAVELRIVVPREQAARKLFGFVLFPDNNGDGLRLVLEPDTRTLRLGAAAAPFAMDDLPPGEDLELRIFVDKYLVEVFANDRQALVAVDENYQGRASLSAWSYSAPTTIKSLDIWKLKPTNQGFLEAQKSRIWEPATE